MLDMFTMTPDFCSSRYGATARVHQNVPNRFISRMARRTSGFCTTKGRDSFRELPPAQFTSPSSLPYSSWTFATSRLTAS